MRGEWICRNCHTRGPGGAAELRAHMKTPQCKLWMEEAMTPTKTGALDAHDIAKVIDILGPVCARNDVKVVRVGDLELEFGTTLKIDQKAVKEFSRAIEAGMPSEEEILNHSAPGYVPPNMQEPMLGGARTARMARK